MSEDNKIKEPTALELLKSEADAYKIAYSPNIGIEALRGKVDGYLEAKAEAQQLAKEELAKEAAIETEVAKRTGAIKAAPITADEKEFDLGKHRQKKTLEATRLVRVIVSCLNPDKSGDDQGNFQAGNAFIETVKRQIPFNVPWYTEQILLNVIREKTYQQRYGKGLLQQRNAKEYQVTEIGDISPQELEELKRSQALKAEVEAGKE